MKKLLSVGLILLSLFCASSALAEGEEKKPKYNLPDQKCSQAFDKKGNVIPNSRIVCNEDVALNGLMMVFHKTLEEVPELKKTILQFGVNPDPIVKSNLSSLIVSHPMYAIFYSMSVLGTAAAISMFAFTFFQKAPKWMSSAEIQKMSQDKGVWKNGGAWAFTAILIFPIGGGFMYFHSLVLSSAIIGLKIATGFVATLLGTIEAMMVGLASPTHTEAFKPQGQEIGEELIVGAVVAQNTARTVNMLNTSYASETMADREAFIWMYDDTPPTVAQWIEGSLDSTHILTQISPTQIGGGKLKATLSGRTTMKHGAYIDGNVVHPELKSLIDYDDIFLSNTFLAPSAALNNDLPKELVNEVKQSEIVGQLHSLYDHSATTKDSTYNRRVEEIGKTLAQKVLEQSQKHGVPLRDVANLYQQFALGILDQKTMSEGYTFTYNPLDTASIPQETIYGQYLRTAYEGADALKNYMCMENLPKHAGDFLAMYRIMNNPRTELAEPLLKGLGATGECMTYTHGSLGVAVNVNVWADIVKIIEEIQKGVNPQITLPEALHAYKIKDMKNEYLSKELSKVQASIVTITNFYSAVGGVTRYANVEAMRMNGEKAVEGLIDKMRKQGPMAIGGYFSMLTTVYNTVSNASEPIMTEMSFSGAHNNTYLTALINQDFTDKEAVVRFRELGVYGREIKNVIAIAADSAFSKDVKSEDDNAWDLAYTVITGDGDPADIAKEKLKRVISDYAAEALIPADEILAQGFFGKESFFEGIEQCRLGGSCVQFNAHPLITISLAGRDMFQSGVTIFAVDGLVQAINTAVQSMNEMSDSLGGDLKKSKGSGWKAKLVGALGDVVDMVTGGYLAVIKYAVGAAAAISSLLAGAASAMVMAGLYLGYVLPLLPIITIFMMFLAWIMEVFMLFTIGPLLLAIGIYRKNDGSSVGGPTLIAKSFISLIFRPALILMSFVLYYGITQMAIYILIVVTPSFTASDLLYGVPDGELSNIIMYLINNVVMYLLLMFLIIVCNNQILQFCKDFPDAGFRACGLEHNNGVGISAVTQIMSVAAVAQQSEKIARSAGIKAVQKIKTSERKKANREVRSEMAAKIKANGFDPNEVLK